MMQDNKKQVQPAEWLLILLVFSICLAGALLLPVKQCPDEADRVLLSEWIVRHGTLPTGNELETISMRWENPHAPLLKIVPLNGCDGWGFSYALRPFLSAVIGAFFQKLASFFTSSPRILLAASRMCSVLSVTFCCFFCLRLGHRLFAQRSSSLLFAAFVCFLPQVMFLGMYQNNDSLSLCAVSMMLYYLAEGFDSGWPVKSCVSLALAFSLGLLSYYTIYGWLLMGAAFCIAAVLTDPGIPRKGPFIFRRAALISGICILLTSWFFLRNAALHEGDFLGMASEEASRARMRSLGYRLFDFLCFRDSGMSILDFLRREDFIWLRLTARSFVGVFGYMDTHLPKIHYRLCYAVFAAGVLLYAASLLRHKPSRRDVLLAVTMLSASLLTGVLHFWQSYTRDYQPQGRYVITLVLFLGYMLAYGLDQLPAKRNARLHPASVLTAGWLALSAWAAIGTMSKML